MIHFIAGKPRSGKSLRAMSLIVQQLTETENYLMTNMALRLDKLQEYLDAQGASVHVLDRVRILTDEETKRFYLYHEFHTLEIIHGQTVDYSPIFKDPRYYVGGRLYADDGAPNPLRGVTCIIDEVQNIFPAGGVHEADAHARFFLTQHGKMNWTIYFLCQAVSHVHKHFRDLAQDFSYCRNYRIEKFGVFRGDDKFVCKTYLSPHVSEAQTHVSAVTYKLNIALAECYDTSAGVGMPGGGRADNAKRAKGVPMWTIIAVIALLVIGSYFVITSGSEAVAKQFILPPAKASNAKANKGEPFAFPVLSGAQGIASSASTAREKRVRSWVVSGRKAQVTLDDGTVFTEADGLQRIERGSVVINGVRYKMITPTLDPVAPKQDAFMTQAKEFRPPSVIPETTAQNASKPPPPAPPVSSWVEHSDGVLRLAKEETLEDMFRERTSVR